jgi:hypothetical protein
LITLLSLEVREKKKKKREERGEEKEKKGREGKRLVEGEEDEKHAEPQLNLIMVCVSKCCFCVDLDHAGYMVVRLQCQLDSDCVVVSSFSKQTMIR